VMDLVEARSSKSQIVNAISTQRGRGNGQILPRNVAVLSALATFSLATAVKEKTSRLASHG
jgi:hypothetical protein